MRTTAAALLLLCACAGGPAPAAASRPPNVVLIVSDDQAWTDYGFMGHPVVKTPRIDRLAAESLAYPRGYVTTALCCPSLASIITGLYPHQHKITSNDPPGSDNRRKDPAAQKAFVQGREAMNRQLEAVATLPKLLAAAGYASLQTGKWWQGHYSRGGFTHGMTKGDRHGDEGLSIGRRTMQPIYDFIADCTKAERPFFVWYAPLLPHDPHTPPDRLLAKYRDKTPSIHVARYWAMVEWFDETVGALLDHLDAQGLSKDTLVVYVADNGWIQKPDGPRFAPKSKRTSYEGGVRTPILLRRPGTIAARRDDTPVSGIDIAPTLLKACGVPAPPGLPGVDLLDAAAVKARPAVFGATFVHTALDLDDPSKNLEQRWVVAGRWKLIAPVKGEAELYDLAVDPHETASLAARQPERVADLRKMLDAWWTP